MEFSTLSEEERVGAHCFEVTPEKECHTEKCPLRRILNGETKVEKDVERRFGGSVMPCAMTCGPYTDSKGNLVGMVENYRDIRERVTAQEMAEKSALQQGRIEMSNNILHDIGNAAVGTGAFIIRLLSEKIWNERRSLERLCAFLSEKKDDIAKALGEEKAGSLIDFAEKLSESLKFRNELVLEQAEKISKSVGHINSVLNLQRQYAKEGVKTGGYVNIASLLENAVLMQSANFEKRDIKLKIKLQVGLPYSVPGDTTRLMQVVLNILKNACEAFDSVRDDRKRFLNVSAVKVGMDGGHLQIIFEDNAVGLSEDIKHKVFSRGFTTKETGSGIGLDQCRSIITSHDGKIWIESDGPDKGVSVIVELPLLRPEN
jgi:PAS domain S-box-containing protein